MPPPKFFDWWDIERIIKSVGREQPETIQEVLAWLRVYHLLALDFRDVHAKITRSFGVKPRSDLGNTIFTTLGRILEAYESIYALYGQRQLEELLEELVPEPTRL